ncbi:MAG: hypothetical protein V1777_04620 [Candidatus Micrarchaeota archaeon]
MVNRKGQGSGVFQLLISAVIAIAILGVLLGILNLISPPGQKVAVIARDKLSQAKTSQGTMITSEKIKVVADDVVSYTVGGPELGIDNKQVGTAVDAALTGFFNHTNGVLRYTGNSARDVKVVAFCLDDTRVNVIKSFSDQLGIATMPISNVKWATGAPTTANVYCIIGIVKG